MSVSAKVRPVPLGGEALRRELEGRDREIDDLRRKMEGAGSEANRRLAEVEALVTDLLEIIGTNPERLSRLGQLRDARTAMQSSPEK